MSINNIPQPNQVIGWVNGKAIMKIPGDRTERLFYCLIPEEYTTIGENLIEAQLIPVAALPEHEQDEIFNYLNSGGG